MNDFGTTRGVKDLSFIGLELVTTRNTFVLVRLAETAALYSPYRAYSFQLYHEAVLSRTLGGR